ncbi:MAG: preprotein translocase subunit SecG [Chlorobiaceae bacterium]|nr:preprotein translocase subunit SecG [Chlorobiaceae bacterium]NTV61686.1 preprotein translocase subunit SecG [Chlorobiaceae bacterium]
MHIFLMIVGLLAAFMLVGVILLQSPKSGSGLTGGISSLGTVQTLGVRRTGDFLTKTTAILAAIVMLACFLAQFTLPGRQTIGGTKSVLQENVPAPAAPLVPAAPVTPLQSLPAAPALPATPAK